MKCPNCGHYDAITYKQYEIAHAGEWIWLTLAFCWLVLPVVLFIVNLIIVSSKPDDGQLICKNCHWQGWL
jgi:hypothetical protein